MTHHTNIQPPARQRAAHQRRGVAMLLVIIALGAATALTSVYLASRKNSGAIGRNAGVAAITQWASRAGAELALATLQSEADWRSKTDDGLLFKDMPLAGASVTVIITNLEGDPPRDHDHELVMTSIAAVDGVYAATQRLVRLAAQVPLADALNPEMDEFGVYVASGLDIGADSIITLWPNSPRAALGEPVKIGFGSTSSGALQIHASAHTSGLMAVLPPGASAALESAVSGPPFVDSWTTPVRAPVIPASDSGLTGLTPMHTGTLQISSPSAQGTLPPGAYKDVVIESGAVVALADGQAYSFEKLQVRTEGVLLAQGDARALITDELEIRDGGAIELADENATLRLVLTGDLRVRDAGVGVTRAIARDTARTPMSVGGYADPTRLRIFGRPAPIDVDDPLAGEPTEYRIENNAIVLGAIHAPEADVLIQTGATVIGRITAFRLTMRDNSALLYDPMLDNRAGFSSPSGPLYTADGLPVAGLVDALNAYDASLGLEGLSAHVSLYVDADAFGDISPSAGWVDAASTPRSASLAWDSVWPMRATALELDSLGVYTLLGSLVVPSGSVNLAGVLVDTTKIILDTGGGLIDGATDILDGAKDGVLDPLEGIGSGLGL